MPFVMFALWTISTVLLASDGRSEKTRWVAFIAFCGGFGALAESIKDNLIPYLLENQTLTPALDSFLQGAFNISYVLNHILGAYAMFGATIVYSGLFRRKIVTLLKAILLVPVFVTIAVSDIFPIVDINWIVLASWAVPYIFVGTGFLIRAYQLESNTKRKTDRLIVLFAVSGPTVTVAFTNYLARCFGYHDLYTSNIIVIGLVFVFIFVVIFKNNFLGIRIKVEKDRHDSNMKVAASGISILNHTIKNEVAKIKMSADICLEADVSPRQHEFLNHIMTAAEYLQDMTQKLQHGLKDVEIRTEETNVADLLTQVVKLNEPLCLPRNISIRAEIEDSSVICQLDRIYVTEVMNSLVKNAVDAMPNGGRILLALAQEKNAVVVSVIDNGVGIESTDLPYVMDPFYSTKKRTNNFGLGLTQGYNIMQQHKGTIQIDSVEGKGTTVRLVFPRKWRVRNKVEQKVALTNT